jgi:hypothetical protein
VPKSNELVAAYYKKNGRSGTIKFATLETVTTLELKAPVRGTLGYTELMIYDRNEEHVGSFSVPYCAEKPR